MPTYCYEKPNGQIIEKIMTISEMEDFDKNPVLDGETVKRRVDVEMRGHRDVTDVWRHPSQVNEMKQHAAKHGVNTDYTKDGRAIFTSRSHRAAHLKAFNMHDRNGGYGD